MSGYLLSAFFSGGLIMTHDETKESPAVQINNARQLLALVKQRPCINPRGTSATRACAIGYAEITVLERMLKSAVEMLTEQLDVPRKPFTSARDAVLWHLAINNLSLSGLRSVLSMDYTLDEITDAVQGLQLDKLIFINNENEYVLNKDANFPRPMGATPLHVKRVLDITPTRPGLHSELEQAVIDHLRNRPQTASELASELANISPSAMEAVLNHMAGKRLVWRDDKKKWAMV